MCFEKNSAEGYDDELEEDEDEIVEVAELNYVVVVMFGVAATRGRRLCRHFISSGVVDFEII